MVFSDLPALQIAGLSIGLREVVLLLIFGVAVYIGVVLYRMRRLSGTEDLISPMRHAGQADEPVRGPAPETAISPAAPMPSAPASPPRDDDSAADRLQRLRMTEESGRSVSGFPLDSSRGGLAQQPAEQLSTELMQLRDEVDALRGALAALREEMHEELSHLRATQSVSPIYGDAMQLAVAGYDAAAIAERCGIARAEAELVAALARSQLK